MKGYHANVEHETLNNTSFRKVAYTGVYSQLVYMRLKPGESIGLENMALISSLELKRATVFQRLTTTNIQ